MFGPSRLSGPNELIQIATLQSFSTRRRSESDVGNSQARQPFPADSESVNDFTLNQDEMPWDLFEA